MRILQWVMVGVILVALLATGASAGQAQTGERPLVVVVEGRRPLDTAAMTNIGPAGISRLADVFRGLGARVQFVRLDAPLPEEAQVVVIARPLRSLPLLQVVYLWQYLERGGSLLLALDPEEFFLDGRNVRPRFNRGGLAPLVAQDFGITVGDTFLAEPLASAALIEELDSTYALTFAELQGEPITAPLARYNVPVWVWGARSMTVDPLGMGSEAVPLLATGTAYGETDPGVFRTSTAPAVAALQFDAGQDVPAGLLTVGARAMRTPDGARIAILGDSELLQNGYGLVRDGTVPRHPGNLVFVQRTAAWLLGLPEDSWPGLPAGWTWLALDGDPADWDGRGQRPASDGEDVAAAGHDLIEAAAFADNRYLYVLLRTRGAPPAAIWVELALPGGRTLRAGPDGAVVTEADGTHTLVPDAALAGGAALELRVPLRVAGTARTLAGVCLGAEVSADARAVDCLETPLAVSTAQTRAPFDHALTGQPLVTAHSANGVNLRRGPGLGTAILTRLDSGTTLAALGRSADGDWIRVQDARYAGWVAAYLVTPNADLSRLPVLPPSE